MLDQPIDGPTRRRAAIDVVAQENVNRSTCWPLFQIVLAEPYELVQEIQPAMDITNGINSDTTGKARDPSINAKKLVIRQSAAQLGPRRGVHTLGKSIITSGGDISRNRRFKNLNGHSDARVTDRTWNLADFTKLLEAPRNAHFVLIAKAERINMSEHNL